MLLQLSGRSLAGIAGNPCAGLAQGVARPCGDRPPEFAPTAPVRQRAASSFAAPKPWRFLIFLCALELPQLSIAWVCSSMARAPVSSIFMINFATNVGYAIDRYEKLFYRVMLDLGGGDSSRVHFSFGSLHGGRPKALPQDFCNYLEFNPASARSGSTGRIEDYVREHGIELAIALDLQPIHPLFPRLRRSGVRTIVSYWGAPISSLQPFWKVGLKRIGYVLSPSRADSLVFESHAMADLAVKGRGVPRTAVDVVYLGVDRDELRATPRSDYVYRESGFPRDRKVIIYSGHMEERKGVATLVDAAIHLIEDRKRSDVCFLICGNRGCEAEPYERMLRGRPESARWIQFAGYRTDLDRLRSGCYCGVIPSTGWDSFTFSAVEMAAVGLPIVASDLQGLGEAVLHEQTGLLFPPGNAKALADCLEHLLDHPEEARRLGEAGRRRCASELNTGVQSRRLVAILERRIRKSRRR